MVLPSGSVALGTTLKDDAARSFVVMVWLSDVSFSFVRLAGCSVRSSKSMRLSLFDDDDDIKYVKV